MSIIHIVVQLLAAAAVITLFIGFVAGLIAIEREHRMLRRQHLQLAEPGAPVPGHLPDTIQACKSSD